MHDDVELLRAWRDGDADAGARLVERHFDGMSRFFGNKVGVGAEDLVQRTFLVALERAGGFRGDSSFRTFLFGIARNVLLEYFRERRRDQRIEPDFGVSSAFDLDPSPSQVVARRGEERLLLEALRRIPLELQMAVELHYWEGTSLEDLARIQEVPLGTIKSRLHRARKLLMEELGRLRLAEGISDPVPPLASLMSR